MDISNLSPPFRGSGGRKVLFIDRDGTIIKEAPPTYQIDSFEKLEFYPGMFTWLSKIAKELNYELVMPTNQDGLGRAGFPESSFWPVHNFIMKHLTNEVINFSDVLIDKTLASENASTRKPGIGMFNKYINNTDYDLPNSFVIGDRATDVQLAKNLGCKAIWINNDPDLGGGEISDTLKTLASTISLETTDWKKIYEFLKLGGRMISHERNTNETKIRIEMNVDGNGKTSVNTGLSFFDHMLDQLGKHSGIDLKITVKGDLHIDEHHTIEDTAIALGETLAKALGNKAGINRYGFVLPMDDSLARVAIDFGGGAGLFGTRNSAGKKLAICRPKCSIIFLNHSAMRLNAT
jgi:imidazoleglycerol-phosphate dehydratase/histidinol-phosphatase